MKKMKFEEILTFMRQGKKARLASDKEGEYWICGKTGNPDLGIPKFFLTMLIVSMCGCGKKCLKSHEELINTVCTGFSYKSTPVIVPCLQTRDFCDKWEK